MRDLVGKAGIYCDQPAKILEVEAEDDPRHVVRQVMPAMVYPQISVKVVAGYGTSVAHMPAMAFDTTSLDADLRKTMAAQVIVLGEEWANGRQRLGVVCATEGNDGSE